MLVAFDLDDTLFDEMDFVDSAYMEIAERVGESPYPVTKESALAHLHDGGFDKLLEILGTEMPDPVFRFDIPAFVKIYREHRPASLPLRKGAVEMLDWLHSLGDCRLGIITDGRKLTQSAKIKAIGLEKYIPGNNILISEVTGHDKTSPEPFLEMMRRNPDENVYVYLGDNTAKDFINPGNLGWQTLCMRDNGRNIHPQNLELADMQTTLGIATDFFEAKTIIENLREKLLN